MVKDLGWKTVKERYHYFMSILMFKCVNGLAPTYLSDQITPISDVYQNLRSHDQYNILVPKPTTEVYKKSFSYMGPTIWNTLPPQVKFSTSLNLFKNNYKICHQ